MKTVPFHLLIPTILLLTFSKAADQNDKTTILKISIPATEKFKGEIILNGTKKVPDYDSRSFITCIVPSPALRHFHHAVVLACDQINGTECIGIQTMFSLMIGSSYNIRFPDGRGIEVGKGTSKRYISLSVHVGGETPPKGIKISDLWVEIHISHKKIQPMQLVWFMNTDFIIPKQKPVSIDTACPIIANITLHITKYALFTEGTGISVEAYVVKNCKHECTRQLIGEIGFEDEHNQEFIPVENKGLTAKNGDVLAVRCRYKEDLSKMKNLPEKKLCMVGVLMKIKEGVGKEMYPNVCVTPGLPKYYPGV